MWGWVGAVGQKSTMKHGAATAQMRKGPNKTCGEGNGKAGAGSRHWAWDQGTWEENFSPVKGAGRWGGSRDLTVILEGNVTWL